MRRILYHSRNPGDQNSENIDTTPLRRSTVRFPRLRLMEKDIKPVQFPRLPLTNHELTIENPGASVVKTYPFKHSRQIYPEDRFTSRNFNMDAANYLLTKQTEKPSKDNKIDVLEQVKSLEVNWRKKCMRQLMVQENVIPGLRQKQVLRSSHLSLEDKLPGNVAGRPRVLLDEEYREDGMWKSKPRKKPLIFNTDTILEMPGFRKTSDHRRRLIDWGARNMIAAAVYDMVVFYDTNTTEAIEPINGVRAAAVCSLKWNHAGNKLMMCCLTGVHNLYCLDTQKKTSLQMCVCQTKFHSPCDVRCVCWTKDDRYVITGCIFLLVVYSVKNGGIVNSIVAHSEVIALSPSERYIATSGMDKNVRIYEWPSLSPYLDIGYLKYVLSLAWHPFESDLLCIGGGPGDGSLSLLNMKKVMAVKDREVRFYGVVDNLIWNKLSGELVVQWSYLEGQDVYTVIPVLASLDRIVDVVPMNKDMTMLNTILWNPDHTQLALQHNESLSIWNFFGDLDQHKRSKKRSRVEEKEGTNARFMNFKEFRHFKIR